MSETSLNRSAGGSWCRLRAWKARKQDVSICLVRPLERLPQKRKEPFIDLGAAVALESPEQGGIRFQSNAATGDLPPIQTQIETQTALSEFV